MDTTTEQTDISSTTDRIAAVCAGHAVPAGRRESLTIAASLGADVQTLAKLRDATRLARKASIIIPCVRYETLSRGRGWCRCGRGDSASWGERVYNGYKVGPGTWIVFGSDGFSRSDRVPWTVRHIQVGDQTWTMAD